MHLEDYFDFADYEKHGEIRIQGHRIWLHDILREHVDRGLNAQQLLERFGTLDMEKIYACLLYFESHREEMLKMLDRYEEYCKASYEKAQREGRVVNMAQLRQRMRERALS